MIVWRFLPGRQDLKWGGVDRPPLQKAEPREYPTPISSFDLMERKKSSRVWPHSCPVSSAVESLIWQGSDGFLCSVFAWTLWYDQAADSVTYGLVIFPCTWIILCNRYLNFIHGDAIIYCFILCLRLHLWENVFCLYAHVYAQSVCVYMCAYSIWLKCLHSS